MLLTNVYTDSFCWLVLPYHFFCCLVLLAITYCYILPNTTLLLPAVACYCVRFLSVDQHCLLLLLSTGAACYYLPFLFADLYCLLVLTLSFCFLIPLVFLARWCLLLLTVISFCQLVLLVMLIPILSVDWCYLLLSFCCLVLHAIAYHFFLSTCVACYCLLFLSINLCCLLFLTISFCWLVFLAIAY